MSFVRSASSYIAALTLFFLLPGSAVADAGADVPGPQPARMQINRESGSVVVSGAVSSPAHELILRQAAGASFGEAGLRLDLYTGRDTPPGWALTTELTLKAMATLRTGQAEILEDRIEIRGITTDMQSWRAATGRVERHLLPGMHLDQQVVSITERASHEEHCRQQFAGVLRGRQIEFARSSDELGSAALPLLDELIEIAVDCPAAIVRVTGYTDASGIESVNQQLSEDRARAVTAYMTDRGIPPERLVAVGAGSSKPLVPNDSANNRRLNRRIEVSVSFR